MEQWKEMYENLEIPDEERAEEYCNNEAPFDTNENGEKLYTEHDLKYAYLEGLKAGKQKWHNLKTKRPQLRKEVLWCVDTQLRLGELLESRIDFGEWELDSVLFNNYEIYWKEIMLPKEIKND